MLLQLWAGQCWGVASAGEVNLFTQIKGKIRTALKWGWVGFLFCTGLLRWAKRRLGAQGGIVVLTFHRVLPEKEHDLSCSPRGMVLRDRTFESLAHHVAAHYELVDLTGAEGWQCSSRKPRLAFTFDDGWLDNARTAFPIARKYDIPLAIFICPERLGKEFPFRPERAVAAWRAAGPSSNASRKIAELLARLHLAEAASRPTDGVALLDSVLETLKKLPSAEHERLIGQMEQIVELRPGRNAPRCIDATMSWTDIVALAAGGVTFGSHTQSHEILPQIPPAEAQRELAESKQIIQQKLQKECLLFAYPNGDCSSEVRDLVVRSGYRLAFLNQAGAWTRECDPFLIPRVNIWEGNLLGPSGRFSRVVFEYTAFWKAYRAGKPKLTSNTPAD